MKKETEGMHPTLDNKKLTYDDLLQYGETHQRVELIDGELIITAAMPHYEHQYAVGEIFAMLRDYVKRHAMGTVVGSPMDIVLEDGTVAQPDLFFISNKRAHINAGSKLTAVPDLVVEVLSPATEKIDRGAKFNAYARGGAAEYWIVSTKQKEIEVYVNQGSAFRLMKIFRAGESLNSTLFPDIDLNVREVFV